MGGSIILSGIKLEHNGEVKTTMTFGEPKQADGVTLIEFVWIYMFGFCFGTMAGIGLGILFF